MLVSCIMPTCNRRQLIPVALRCFLSQDWPRKELVVVDDGPDSVEYLVKKLVPDAVYIHLSERQMIGTKRNLACESAHGSVICHFDDDDWSAGGRIRDQVMRLLVSGKQMTGYHSVTYWNGMRAYRYTSAILPYALGATMCYQRSFWKTYPFPPRSYAEDNALVYKARDERELITVDAGSMMVVRSHAASTTSPRKLRQHMWPDVPPESLPREFHEEVVSRR